MSPVKSIADAFKEFATSLERDRADVVKAIGLFKNGFEGWLKLEFLMWLSKTNDLEIGTDVGIEYRVKLDPAGYEVWKQCDLWVRASEATYHYVELKAPFANGNSGKMLMSAGYDFWYMSRLRHTEEQVNTGNAIVVGVRFDDDAWERARSTVRAAAGLSNLEEPVPGRIGTNIRYDVWTKTY
jgi:hypothetical protein